MRNEVPIQEHHIKNKISTGITYGVQVPGLVADFEELEAMRFHSFNEIEWNNFDSKLKARYVAFYRITRYIELNQSDAQHRAMDRKSRK